MPDGHRRSGRSTGSVSCKRTELKRCSVTEMRWDKFEVSLRSPVWTQIIVIIIIIWQQKRRSWWVIRRQIVQRLCQIPADCRPT